MSSHYTHLIKIEFKDGPNVFHYNGCFDKASAKEELKWQTKQLDKDGYVFNPLTIVEVNQ